MNIKSFLSNRGEMHKQPFEMDGCIYATNGYFGVKTTPNVPELDGIILNDKTDPNYEKNIVKAREYFREMLLYAGSPHQDLVLTKLILKNRMEKHQCPECEGKGTVVVYKCRECNGKGELELSSEFNTYTDIECLSCMGNGVIDLEQKAIIEAAGNAEVIGEKVPDYECDGCLGKGILQKYDTIRFNNNYFSPALLYRIAKEIDGDVLLRLPDVPLLCPLYVEAVDQERWPRERYSFFIMPKREAKPIPYDFEYRCEDCPEKTCLVF